MQRTHVRPSAGHRQYARSNTSNIYAKLHESKKKIKQKIFSQIDSLVWFMLILKWV